MAPSAEIARDSFRLSGYLNRVCSTTQPTPSRKLLTSLEYKADLLVIEDGTTTGGSSNVHQLIFPENNLPRNFARSKACNSTMIRLREGEKKIIYIYRLKIF